MSRVESFKYTCCAVIVHGRSELHLTKFIYTNLRLPVKIFSRENGRKSIQINGLKDFLNGKQFRNLGAFAKKYAVEYDRKQKKLKNFRLFIIMDTDDCDEKTREEYISGKMFRGHLMQDYIVPIYNIENLEDVMMKAGIMTKRIRDSEKEGYYSRIFPINTDPLCNDTLQQIREFAIRVKRVKQTNILKFIEYCFSQLPGAELWEIDNGQTK